METTAEEDSEEIVCPNCMRGNVEGAHFCRYCVTPLDTFAATDPMGRIYAEFDTLGKASHKPRNAVVVVGMWLILGPFFVGAGSATAALLFSLGDAWGDPKRMGITMVSIAVFGVIAVVSGMLLWRTTANYSGKGKGKLEEEEKDDELSREAMAETGEGDS